jgi:hypothetical protein
VSSDTLQLAQAFVLDTERFVRPFAFGGFGGIVTTVFGGGGGGDDCAPPILVDTEQNKCRELTI